MNKENTISTISSLRTKLLELFKNLDLNNTQQKFLEVEIDRILSSFRFEQELTSRLTISQQQKLKSWLEAQRIKAITKQQSNIDEKDIFYSVFKSSWELGYPYSGAIGGEVGYTITPTSLGVIQKVTYHLTGETIDLTLYDEW